MTVLTVELPESMVEQIAQRAAQIILAEAVSPGDSRELSGYLDVAGAARFLACPPKRVYNLVSARRLPHHRDGSRLLFDPAELREYVLAGGAKCP